MTTFTIQIENPEEENFLETFLKKMKISFQKEKEEDFELTDEMKRVLDERLKDDRSNARDAWEVMAELDAKYGL